MRYLKPAIFLLALLPLGRLIWLGSAQDLGANPIEFITRSMGTWTLVFLCLSLAMTPARMLIGWTGFIHLRRMLGLFCFFYATVHFLIWLWLDHNFSLAAMWQDVLERPYITFGFIAFVLLIPLALTSNHWAQRKLGRRWSHLHRLVYAIAVLAILHYWWHKAGKSDYETVSIYLGVIVVLLLLRLPFIRQFVQIKK
ncbi:MAG: sulfite oxidase heme-binding subunit YedZ [Polynucleobacter sp.]